VVKKKMEKQEAKDKAFNDLGKISEFLALEIEKFCLVRIGRDAVERRNYFDRIAEIIYGTLITEVKAAFRQDSQARAKSVEEW